MPVIRVASSTTRCSSPKSTWGCTTCCRTTIRLARRLRHLRPELEISVFYIDLQVMSKEFGAFYEQARDEGIRFLQGVPAEIVPGEDPDVAIW